MYLKKLNIFIFLSMALISVGQNRIPDFKENHINEIISQIHSIEADSTHAPKKCIRNMYEYDLNLNSHLPEFRSNSLDFLMDSSLKYIPVYNFKIDTSFLTLDSINLKINENLPVNRIYLFFNDQFYATIYLYNCIDKRKEEVLKIKNFICFEGKKYGYGSCYNEKLQIDLVHKNMKEHIFENPALPYFFIDGFPDKLCFIKENSCYINKRKTKVVEINSYLKTQSIQKVKENIQSKTLITCWDMEEILIRNIE